jgi:hypothetical protein
MHRDPRVYPISSAQKTRGAICTSTKRLMNYSSETESRPSNQENRTMKPPKRLFKDRPRDEDDRKPRVPLIAPVAPLPVPEVKRTPIAQHFSPVERRYTATHEAGHAVAAIMLGIPLIGVDIIPRIIEEGWSRGKCDTAKITVGELNAKGEEGVGPYIIQILAGYLAEKRVNPNAREQGGWRLDFKGAWEYALGVCCEFTPSREGGQMMITGADKECVKDRAREILRAGKRDAERFVEDNEAAIGAVRDELLRRKKLTGDEVAAIVNATD